MIYLICWENELFDIAQNLSQNVFILINITQDIDLISDSVMFRSIKI